MLPKIKRFFFTYTSALRLSWDTSHRQTSVILICSSLTGLLKLPTFYFSATNINLIVSSFNSPNPTSIIPQMAFYLFLLFLIEYLNQFLDNTQFSYQQNLSRRVNEHLNIKIQSKLNQLSIQTSEDPTTRNLFQKVNDNSGRSTWGVINNFSNFPNIIFALVSSSIYIISFQPLLLIPAALISVPHILVGMGYSKKRHQFTSSNSHLWRLYTAFDDLISKGRYMYENKILNHAKHMLKERNKIVIDIFNQELNIESNFNRKRQIVYLPQNLFTLAIRTWVYYLAIVRQLALGNAQAIANSIGSFSGNFSWLIRTTNDLYQNYLFIKDYEDFLDLKDEAYQGAQKLMSLTQGLEFRDVWFRYPHSDKYILKGVSFRIDPTDNLAIVGVNGAGKSTLIKLICRFYQPEKGQILLNGKDINEYSLSSYRHAISALFQDFAQYPFSALVNISYGDIKRKSTLARVRHAAKLADIDHFLSTLPKRYQTPLDKEFKGGVEPSKGQWQRIALARALYRKSPIIILDEPTSNVDPETEEVIFDRILKVAANKCVILVSHRFSTVKRADQILVLEDGVVAQIGSHEQLMRSRGAYHRLYSLQAASYQS